MKFKAEILFLRKWSTFHNGQKLRKTRRRQNLSSFGFKLQVANFGRHEKKLSRFFVSLAGNLNCRSFQKTVQQFFASLKVFGSRTTMAARTSTGWNRSLVLGGTFSPVWRSFWAGFSRLTFYVLNRLIGWISFILNQEKMFLLHFNNLRVSLFSLWHPALKVERARYHTCIFLLRENKTHLPFNYQTNCSSSPMTSWLLSFFY